MEPDLLIRLGKNGAIVVPHRLRQLFNFEEGELVVARARECGVLVSTFKTYSEIKKAEFLLSNVISHKDYEEVIAKVESMGFDPQKIPHGKPTS